MIDWLLEMMDWLLKIIDWPLELVKEWIWIMNQMFEPVIKQILDIILGKILKQIALILDLAIDQMWI